MQVRKVHEKDAWIEIYGIFNHRIFPHVRYLFPRWHAEKAYPTRRHHGVG